MRYQVRSKACHVAYADDESLWIYEPWSSVSSDKSSAIERAKSKMRHLCSILVDFPHVCAVQVVGENGETYYSDRVQLSSNIVTFPK